MLHARLTDQEARRIDIGRLNENLLEPTEAGMEVSDGVNCHVDMLEKRAGMERRG